MSEGSTEERHFSNVVATFRKYTSYHLAANNRRRKDLFTLPKADRELLEQLGYKEKLDQVDKAILANEQFLNKIVIDPEIFGDDGNDAFEEGDEEGEAADPSISARSHSHSHSHSPHSHSHSHSHSQPHSLQSPKEYKPTEFDMDKLRSTLKQFVRDWSAEGQEERETSYGPMKDALLAHFSDIPKEERRNFRVLVPGAGLGRLAYDIASLGFACQGNEFSHYMLLASFLILNKTERPNMHTIYPYVHSFSNVPDRTSMLRPIKIPDVEPTLPSGSVFSLVAGDFEEIYGGESDPNEPQAGLWDAVMTCFFIDTAKNIVNYLRIVHKILAPGGVWINLGPLLWHWENNHTNDPSIELDLVEVKQLAAMVGFEIENERTIDATYTTNSQGMLGYTYRTAFWTAKKKI
ncbi:N2227-like protein-domain-containing protein [Lentinula lateritia]|uniref:carnosine N-methyltransferase n=1 Tax=Lentinula lateritia TaxID=40482 RepID=A0ABQ8VC11_9AGAR|nr:N2227-like protein-domain-containing protein [Lentinula lateritia]